MQPEIQKLEPITSDPSGHSGLNKKVVFKIYI